MTRRDALAVVPSYVVDKAVAAGAIRSVFPGVYSAPGLADVIQVRRAAALRYRPDGALSHLDALDEWGLLPSPEQVGADRHVTVSEDQHACRVRGIVVHRRRAFVPEPPATVVRRGLRLVRLEQAIVDSWSLLPELDRRVPAIVAVRERHTNAQRLHRVLDGNLRVAGRTEMRRVFSLVAAGCHSPLELWGHEKVFDHPNLPPASCQFPVSLPTGKVYLDRYYEAERLAVELDGAAYHGEPGQRERDNRRDALLATLGIQTVRYSHPRLHADHAGARAELREILRARRRQFGLPEVS